MGVRDILIRIRSDSKQAKKDIQDVGAQLDSFGRGVTGQYKNIDKSLKSVNRELGRNSMRFKYHMLGVMFFGMMIQRTFQNILRTTVDTFMKITEAQTIQGQALTALSAQWEFLKFTLGNALGDALIPLLPKITEIIEAIADWIDQNPKLAAGIIMAGLAAGTFFMTLGQLSLGFAAIKMWLLGGGVAGPGIIASLTGAGTGFLTLALIGVLAAGLITSKFQHFAEDIPLLFKDMFKILESLWGLFITIMDADVQDMGLKFQELSVGIYQFVTNALGSVINFIKGIALYVGTLMRQLGIPTMVSPEELDRQFQQLMERTTGQQIRAFLEGRTLEQQKRHEDYILPGMFMTDEEIMSNLRAGGVGASRFDEINIEINTPAINTELDIKKIAEEIGNQFNDVVRNYTNTTTGKWLA